MMSSTPQSLTRAGHPERNVNNHQDEALGALGNLAALALS